MSAWCSRSVHVVHVMADQEHRNCTVPVQDGTGMEICNANCACATCWIVPLIAYSVNFFARSDRFSTHIMQVHMYRTCMNMKVLR